MQRNWLTLACGLAGGMIISAAVQVAAERGGEDRGPEPSSPRRHDRAMTHSSDRDDHVDHRQERQHRGPHSPDRRGNFQEGQNRPRFPQRGGGDHRSRDERYAMGRGGDRQRNHSRTGHDSHRFGEPAFRERFEVSQRRHWPQHDHRQHSHFAHSEFRHGWMAHRDRAHRGPRDMHSYGNGARGFGRSHFADRPHRRAQPEFAQYRRSGFHHFGWRDERPHYRHRGPRHPGFRGENRFARFARPDYGPPRSGPSAPHGFWRHGAGPGFSHFGPPWAMRSQSVPGMRHAPAFGPPWAFAFHGPARPAFTQLDMDHDGKITKDEVLEIFAKFDTDGDGSISHKELIRAMSPTARFGSGPEHQSADAKSSQSATQPPPRSFPPRFPPEGLRDRPGMGAGPRGFGPPGFGPGGFPPPGFGSRGVARGFGGRGGFVPNASHLMERFDTDHKGVLTKDKVPPPIWDRMVSKADQDGDGSVSKSELETYLETLRKDPPKKEANETTPPASQKADETSSPSEPAEKINAVDPLSGDAFSDNQFEQQDAETTPADALTVFPPAS